MKFPSFSSFFNCVNIVYSRNSVYSYKSVFAVVFSLSFLLQMVFGARCVCSKHDTWRHGEVVAGDLRVAAVEELRFCEVDTSKNKGRKRKICEACRGRIATELKCLRLQVRFILSTILFEYVVVNDGVGRIIFCTDIFGADEIYLSHVARLNILLRSRGDILPG